MTPRAIASAYVELINAQRYDEVGELWAEDGVLYAPQGWVFEGREAVSGFYSSFRGQNIPPMREVSYAEDNAANTFTLELATRMTRDEQGKWQTDPDADFSLASLDLFTVNADGKVQKMIAYIAPPNRWLAS